MRHAPFLQSPVVRQDWLEEKGYRLYTRQMGWWEVLAVAPGERWLGRGGTFEEALEDILGQMFPSRASRQVLEGFPGSPFEEEPVRITPPTEAPVEPSSGEGRTLGIGRGESKDTVAGRIGDTPWPEQPPTSPVPSAPDTDVRESGSPEETGSLRTEAGPEPDSTLEEEPFEPGHEAGMPSPSDTSSLEGVGEVPDTAAARPPPGTGEAAGVDPPAPALPGQAPETSPLESLSDERGPERRDTLSKLGILRQEILDRRDDFGRLSPLRQRLILTYWAARMRGLQGRHEGDREVDAQAQAIARLLGDLAAIHWPGNVPILGLQCGPTKALTILPKDRRPVVRCWEEVAETMESALRRDEEDASVDEDGWGDEKALEPRCAHPEEEFAGLFGQIGRQFPNDDELSRPPPKSLPPELLATSQEQRRTIEQKVLAWARLARWLRQDATDVVRWGRVMGRLRWIVAHWPRNNQDSRAFRERLGETLDERFCPALPWARLLGRNASEKARRQARRELGRRLSTLDVSDTDALQKWFLESVRDVELPTLLKWLESNAPLRDALQRLVEQEPDLLQPLSKTQRRRARRLLRGVTDLPPDEEDPEQDSEEAEREEEEVPEESQAPSNGPGIPYAVLAFTKGKRAVFVGNRGEDPELHTSLEERLEFAELDFVDGTDPRRLDGLVERITGGSYDMVLAATGFLPHRADQRLLPACRARGVPYFRVHRGRPGACVRAIARGIGASGASESD